MSRRCVVIMAGGRGERFWPLSRQAHPKQLLPIVGQRSLLSQALDRVRGVVDWGDIRILTNNDHREAIIRECPDLDPRNVVGEPVGRDTAAAVGLGALLVGQIDPDATMAVLPADHVIHDREGFQQTLLTSFEVAESAPDGALVTIGIRPTHAATGYGYVHLGAPLEGYRQEVFRARAFVEKPSPSVARTYLESGRYVWNAGMFVWRLPALNRAMQMHAPELWERLAPVRQGLVEGQSLEGLLAQHYPSLPRISIDYAVMERAEAVYSVAATFDWDDVGEWSAVARHFAADEQGNVVLGTAVVEEGSGNIVWARAPERVVALLGLSDLVVIQTPDATLICPRDRAQQVKKLVQRLSSGSETERFT